MSKIICNILHSSNKQGMYLYVEKSQGLKRVPEILLERLGKLKPPMTLLLTPERKLANADVEKVMAAIQEQGFFLQLPKDEDDYMREIAQANSKIGGN